MKRGVKRGSLWFQGGLALLLIILAIIAFISAETKPLNKDELKISAGHLRSFSSAGRQLSEQFKSGQLTETFFKTQSSLLQEKAQSERRKLDSADPEKGFELAHWQVRHLAKQVEEALNGLHQSPEASAAKDELAPLFQQSKELEDSLKQ